MGSCYSGTADALSLQGDAFQLEQGDFSVHATGVAGEVPLRADHTVTRDDDRDGIESNRHANSAAGSRAIQLVRHFAIRAQFTSGNVQ